MKQRIKELLKLATAFSSHNSRPSYGYGHGDTYARYCDRCRMSGLTPKQFPEWLAFEVKLDASGRQAGHQPHLESV